MLEVCMSLLRTCKYQGSSFSLRALWTTICWRVKEYLGGNNAAFVLPIHLFLCDILLCQPGWVEQLDVVEFWSDLWLYLGVYARKTKCIDSFFVPLPCKKSQLTLGYLKKKKSTKSLTDLRRTDYAISYNIFFLECCWIDSYVNNGKSWLASIIFLLWKRHFWKLISVPALLAMLANAIFNGA